MRNFHSLFAAAAIAAASGCASQAQSSGSSEPSTAAIPTVAYNGVHGREALRATPTDEELDREPGSIQFIWFDGVLTTWEKVCPNDSPARRCYLRRTDDHSKRPR